MKKIIVLGGSNSKKSMNKVLAIYAANQLKSVALNVLDLNDYDLPLYGIDLELEEGIHAEAKRLNEEFDKADGFVVSLAEHNGSYSVAFKNAFDWLSRVNGKVWRQKPVLLMATSPGGRGGATVLQTAATSFPHMGGNITGTYALPSFYDNFKEGVVVDDNLKATLLEEIEAFQKAIDL
jgi:NAD(P)H-dependent FMN reductase